MNTTNFDWLGQIPANDPTDNVILKSLGLETSDLTTTTSIYQSHGDQDVVKYLFDPAQFVTPLDSSTSPQVNSSQNVSSKGGTSSSTNGDSPQSTRTNNTGFAALPIFDSNWITNTNSVPLSTQLAPPTIHNTTINNANSRKIRVKKKREPIFVTESPQNAYKKKTKKTTPRDSLPKDQHHHNDSSPSSNNFTEQDISINISRQIDKQHMTSKERRQLRNKISARNFRVRRKEYIIELENMVDEQEDEIDTLKQENKRLTDLNQQLVEEAMRLRLQQFTDVQPQHVASQQNYPEAYSLMVSPPNSDTNSPPNIMDTLLEFGAFNSNNNDTYLSYSLMPTLDLSAILGDKLQSPPSSIELEEHQQAMTIYPLLAPALASIVLRHTFNLHYTAYLANTFPYNATTPLKNKILDIMHPEDWITASLSTHIVVGDGDDDPHKNRLTESVSSHRIEQNTKSSSSNQSDTWTENFERQVLRQHYPYYALMRLRGLSHDEIIRRCRSNMDRRMASERQRYLNAAASYNKLQTFHAFAVVASTLIRNPSRSAMISGVIRDTKACQITPKGDKRKSAFMIASSFRTTLRIGGGKT